MFYKIYSFSLLTLIILSLGYDIFMNGDNNKGDDNRFIPRWMMMFILAFIPYLNTIILIEAIMYQFIFCIFECYVEYKISRLNVKK